MNRSFVVLSVLLIVAGLFAGCASNGGHVDTEVADYFKEEALFWGVYAYASQSELILSRMETECSLLSGGGLDAVRGSLEAELAKSADTLMDRPHAKARLERLASRFGMKILPETLEVVQTEEIAPERVAVLIQTICEAVAAARMDMAKLAGG